jgi:hypothetical protein
MAATAGTSIGNAAVLVTSATGSLGSTEQDDWWVIYPTTTGGTVKLDVSDTTPASAPCTDVSFTIDGPDGGNGPLASDTLGADPSQDDSVAQPRSGFYYVEVDTAYCGSVTQPVTYSLHVLSGGGGKVPTVRVGKTGAGGSIGYVGTALAGATVYSGTVVTTSNQYWYQLYKPSSNGTGTVRFADTTVSGSAPCSDVDVTLTDSDGNSLSSAVLGDNTAVAYSVTNAGHYYLEVSAAYCGGSDGATYSIEPNPASAWGGTPTITKISPAKGPASGHTLVKIYGTWLSGASIVLFGTARGTKIHVLSSTELTVVSPAHARGAVNVTVTTGAGRSATGPHSRYTFG